MLRTALSLVAAITLLALPLRAEAKLTIVATLPDLAAIAQEIGGEQAKVTAMALPSQDPHFVDAKPSLALELSRADLLLLAGLDLEIGWLPVLVTGSRNARIQKGAAGWVDCSSFVEKLEVPTGPIDRSMGDIHPGGNPHYLFDPRRGLEVARGITDAMAVADPEQAESYRAGLARFEQNLQADIARWETQAAPLDGLPVLTYHRSMVYLADWIGLNILDELEPKPGIPPKPSQLTDLLILAQRQGAQLILQESFYPSTTSQAVASKSGMELVVLPGGTDFAGGQGYREHLDELLGLVVAAAGAQP
jgi:zinc/manganese transport system substrate-binding protein